MTITRTWKRDGSTNHMTLEAASRNLSRFAKDRSSALADRDGQAELYAERLRRGERVETPLATFRASAVSHALAG